MSKRETKDNQGTSNHATKEIREGNIKNEGQGQSVSLSIKLINISFCLGNMRTKSRENSAGLCCYVDLIKFITLKGGKISILLVLY